MRRKALLVLLLVSMFSLGALTAQAHSSASGHGQKACGSDKYVVTKSKSAGLTSHHRQIGSSFYAHNFGNVSPSQPNREWAGPTWVSVVNDWGVIAQVLESHSAVCYIRPI